MCHPPPRSTLFPYTTLFRSVIIEKPSVLRLQQLDELVALAQEKNVLAKVVYHKLCDPDHKKLRTLVHDGERSEEHTSELQSLRHLVCRLLLEKKKKKNNT